MIDLELNEAMLEKNPARALRLVDELSRSGQSLDAFARGVVTNFRNLMLLKIDPELAPMVDLAPDQVQKLQEQAAGFSEQDLLALIDSSGRHFERIHRSTQPRILLEASVVEYCRFESRVLLSDLARRLAVLGGGASLPGAGGSPETRTSGGSPTPRRSAGEGMSGRAAAPSGASAGTTVQGWTKLIDMLMKKAPRVASCLMEGLPSLDLAAGRLTVAFTADKKFQVTSVQSECGTIETAAAVLYGKPVKVELVMGQNGQHDQVKEEIRQEVAPTAREELDRARAGDKALDKLVETMGGEPLPESEREKWDRTE